MHICHVITRLIIGGAQENTILTCEGLHNKGHQVTLISGPTLGPEGSLVERAKSGGYAFIEIPELVRAIRPVTDLRARRALRDCFEILRPDVVHTHSSKAGIIGRYAARDASVPHIIHSIHGMAYNRAQSKLLYQIARLSEKRATRFTHKVVTVADAMIDQTVAAGVCDRERMCTVYSGMEVDRFDPERHDRAAIRSAWGVSDGDVVVGTVARLFKNKGYEALIPIMHEAVKRVPQLKFVWIGDGAQRGDYEAELERLGLRDRVTLTGLVPPDRVPSLLAGCDILAHTSHWEGLPRAVVQALLMRVPAVAFDIDGTPEVVLDGQTGRLIPLGNRSQFVDALVSLADDRRLRSRMGDAGRELCVKRFDWRHMVDELEKLYLSL